MSFFSCAWVSGMTITARKPSALDTIAMPIPVLPAVPSTTDPTRTPRRARSRRRQCHRRAVLTEPPGFVEFRLAENCASRRLGSGAKLDERRAADRGDNIA